MDRMYQFAVIHHQRWWPHKGWSDFLLPQDPPTWCDPSLQSVPAIDLFSLPPPILGRGYWLWVDPTWQTVQDAETDHDGWEYAKWDWKQWSSNSAGLAAVTRRKRYVRCARFIEDAGDNDKLEQDSMVGGSASTTRRSSWCTNNSYISSFTTESSSSFTSTID
ncbi:uncharacterized protein BYT42DRAFT_548073 [Radiomyces spectabilis]|uniref:uncharacterized protein n=1 Tax=Radiomyces spectabilis TaxID=64574 RepID=UPI00221EF602|nr:uncharacterized protein BYT42DRAFT_548073 [Radiomyces spectabilis]KAI8373082.1 hypothetical protein BYT42DRAFT_548073 [Radiomyces spectabilis]